MADGGRRLAAQDPDEYRDVSRLGRRTRIGGKQREAHWAVFERAREQLDSRHASSSTAGTC